MPKTIQTSGDPGVDRELDALWRAIAALPAPTAATPASAPAAAAQTVIQGGSGLAVQDNAATQHRVTATILTIDTANTDQTLTITGSQATLSRAAATTTPSAPGAAAAGTSQHAANADHVHPAVITTLGDLLTFGTGPVRLAVGSNGQVLTANSGDTNGLGWAAVAIPVVSSDPGSPAAGELWYRSDLNELSIYTGSATKRVAMS